MAGKKLERNLSRNYNQRKTFNIQNMVFMQELWTTGYLHFRCHSQNHYEACF